MLNNLDHQKETRSWKIADKVLQVIVFSHAEIADLQERVFPTSRGKNVAMYNTKIELEQD